jgi:putative acetyltransferase
MAIPHARAVDRLRPVEPDDAPAIAALFAACGAHNAIHVDPTSAWTTQPSGDEEHLLGEWRGEALVGVARLVALHRLRMRHTGQLHLLVAPGESAAALLGALVAFADHWTHLDRLQLALPVGHAATTALLDLGFVPEVIRVGREPDGSDNLLYGRLRPGQPLRPAGPPPPWPSPRPFQGGTVVLRPPRRADLPAIRALSTEPTHVWATLQTPTASVAFYAHRHEQTPPDHHLLVVEVDGEVVGMGGLHPTDTPGVGVVGMGLANAAQGQGLGRRLLQELLAVGVGLRRIELTVYDDNHRARRLYESVGFVAEGTRRRDVVRAGGYANSIDMALRSRS